MPKVSDLIHKYGPNLYNTKIEYPVTGLVYLITKVYPSSIIARYSGLEYRFTNEEVLMCSQDIPEYTQELITDSVMEEWGGSRWVQTYDKPTGRWVRPIPLPYTYSYDILLEHMDEDTLVDIGQGVSDIMLQESRDANAIVTAKGASKGVVKTNMQIPNTILVQDLLNIYSELCLNARIIWQGNVRKITQIDLSQNMLVAEDVYFHNNSSINIVDYQRLKALHSIRMLLLEKYPDTTSHNFIIKDKVFHPHLRIDGDFEILYKDLLALTGTSNYLTRCLEILE